MRQVHQGSIFKRCKMGTSSLRFWLGLSLTLAMGFWSFTDASAFGVSPISVSFQAFQCTANPNSQTVTLSQDKESPAVEWTTKEDTTWLTVSPGTGSLKRRSQVQLSVDTLGLPPGTYTTTVTIMPTRGSSEVISVTLLVSAAVSTSRTTATLNWSPNTEPNLAGYKLYQGTTYGVYGYPMAIGNVTSYMVNSLEVGKIYFFSVTAYDTSGNESPHSNVVCVK
jgi:Viral BACON domain